jgi:hypothetical protein
LKVCIDHPLISYVEDPLASGDVEGYQKIITKFGASSPQIKIGIKAMFNEGGLEKLRSVTEF